MNNRLKVLRAERDWSQAQLAEHLGVSRITVSAAMDRLRAENDHIVARLYGITAPEFIHLLRSFKGMAAKRPEYMALLQAG